MWRFFCVGFLLLAFHSSALSQVYPVLYDANDQPIGYVVSLASGRVVMVSRQGYLAQMSYLTSTTETGTDEVGFPVSVFYESSDCTGDPVTKPTDSADSQGLTNYPNSDIFSDVANLDRYSTQAMSLLYGEKYPSNGGLLEFAGGVYYVPLNVISSSLWARSYKRTSTSGQCSVLDRCNASDLARFSHLVAFPVKPVNPPAGGFCPGEEVLAQIPVIFATGFRASALVVNDSAVTGFQSTAYQFPVRIEYVDIETILADGFEEP